MASQNMQRILEKEFPKSSSTKHTIKTQELREKGTNREPKESSASQTNFSLGLYRILKHRSYREEEKILRKHTPRTHAISRFMEGVSAKNSRERERERGNCNSAIASAFLSATTCEEGPGNSVWLAGWRKPSAWVIGQTNRHLRCCALT